VLNEFCWRCFVSSLPACPSCAWACQQPGSSEGVAAQREQGSRDGRGSAAALDRSPLSLSLCGFPSLLSLSLCRSAAALPCLASPCRPLRLCGDPQDRTGQDRTERATGLSTPPQPHTDACKQDGRRTTRRQCGFGCAYGCGCCGPASATAPTSAALDSNSSRAKRRATQRRRQGGDNSNGHDDRGPCSNSRRTCTAERGCWRCRCRGSHCRSCHHSGALVFRCSYTCPCHSSCCWREDCLRVQLARIVHGRRCQEHAWKGTMD
jgi:hypothetical protein